MISFERSYKNNSLIEFNLINKKWAINNLKSSNGNVATTFYNAISTTTHWSFKNVKVVNNTSAENSCPQIANNPKK